MHTLKTLTLAAAALTAIAATPASAAIICDGTYQIVDGHAISTPYCEHNELARVARSYGMRISNRAVRWNASAKAEACRLVGYDNRVSNVCAGEMNDFHHKGGRR